ncbi:MAG: TIGR04282 family arsenosugar biosynthesis glycosyltransferase [Kovacikia sp.]
MAPSSLTQSVVAEKLIGVAFVSECLIIFTRYPEPGKAKTRLIPALGPRGAAELHRQMAEYTLAQVRQFRAMRSLSVEVRFVGGDLTQMEGWLGSDLAYKPQGAGDLGDRMFHACQSAWNDGYHSMVILGTDCPELDAALLQKAFQELQQQDLVVGPATDGGYYLIGLRQPVPELFQGITWSTSTVFQQTLEIAAALGLTIACLPTLSDVDQPEDLKIWQRRMGSGARGVEHGGSRGNDFYRHSDFE